MPVNHAAPKLESVLDELGHDIVSGVIATGDRFTLHDICERFGISRTVAREAMRALEQLNLVRSARRVGLTVLPREEWNVFDAAVIRWRLKEDAERDQQLHDLTQLRLGIEPIAARSMARLGSPEARQQLVELGHRLRALGEAGQGDTQEFLDADVEYHRLILVSCGNPMFAAMAPSITTVLVGRTELGLQPKFPAQEAMDGHENLAAAIAEGDGDRAEKESYILLKEVRSALFNY